MARELGGWRPAYGARTAVEDDQGASLQIEAGQVLVELDQGGLEWVALTLAADLELDHLPLNRVLPIEAGVRLADEQVDPASADAVLAYYMTTAIDDSLQVGHEDELRCDLVDRKSVV